MQHALEITPALGIGLALAVGVVAQVVARHLLMPGIVLLLGAGVLMGPDVLDLVRPAELGETVETIVGFAIAIILFEGGLNLDIGRMRADAAVIRRLVTIGAIVTAAGGAIAAHWIMGWEWTQATLFGTLVIVTGPTVVTPLLRRIKVKPNVSHILEAEGVIIDPIGAIIAVVALEVLTAGETTLWGGLAQTGIVLGGGAALGAVGGLVVAFLLKPRRVVPEGLENIFVLAVVIALFQVGEFLLAESGLAAVVAAGMVVGNTGTRATQELLEFKEQLTVLMIGLLFVLLAADVRLSEVQALGTPALLTVATLMFLVRPAQVGLCTIGTNLAWRERAFLAYLAPRGIVAAAIASFFAQTISDRGLPGGDELRALVFMVIAVTVTVQGITGGWIAKLLGVRRPPPQGYAILGANPLSLVLARLLGESETEVVLVDSNPDSVQRAEREGLRVLYGQGLQPSLIQRIVPDGRVGCIALTTNPEVNLLWANRVRAETRVPGLFVALTPGPQAIPTETAREANIQVLFGSPLDVDGWCDRVERDETEVGRWRYVRSAPVSSETPVADLQEEEEGVLLFLTHRRGDKVQPFGDEVSLREKDEADIAIVKARRSEAESWLLSRGWASANPVAPVPNGEVGALR